MARQSIWALIALVTLGTAPAQAGDSRREQRAQTPAHQEPQRDGRRDHNRGPWWNQSHPVAVELALTPDQSGTIDRIFWAYVERSKPLRGEVNQLEKALDQIMRANTADISVVEQESARIEKKRAELNKMRTVMLYSIRRVLNPEQNVKFQKFEDRRADAERKKQDGDRRK